jgi:vacuolar-type H+-ATPase subunit F/Vma7
VFFNFDRDQFIKLNQLKMVSLVKGTLLIAAIGDIGTVTGLLLTGMGERNAKGQTNFMVVDKETQEKDIETYMRSLLNERTDIGIILI